MRKLLLILIVVVLLLCPCLLGAEETGKIPRIPELTLLSEDISAAIRENPISLPEYIAAEFNFVSDIMAEILKTGRPVGILKTPKKGWLGAEVTLWDRGEFCWVVGVTKTDKEEDEKEDEKLEWFWGIEKRGIPWARDIWKIFDRLDIGLVVLERRVYVSLAYEFKVPRARDDLPSLYP